VFGAVIGGVWLASTSAALASALLRWQHRAPHGGLLFMAICTGQWRRGVWRIKQATPYRALGRYRAACVSGMIIASTANALNR